MIPTDFIRRFPFANAIPHISDTMQAIIARDMAEQAKREGHRQAFPPLWNKEHEKGLVKLARDEETVFRHVSAGASTIGHIRAKSNLDKPAIQRAVASLVADGRVIMGQPKGQTHTYIVNPAYQPAEAVQTLARDHG